ncbi:hypothetical protein M2302_005732 [Micromonospora sp. A200]|uniref:hypothetical protein n=1 Tax=Micromonospora sp. A200 TaxID=2940568 RepID=UPI0024756E5C|nr:hypothetical protein [Micromonospora sp. A200]MDH6465530.1 hypothetical protein [Micromonospora sp. A200]
MRRGHLIGLVAATVAVALLCCGGLVAGSAFLLLRPENAHAVAYADQLTVGQGYRQLADSDWSDGTCGCNLLRSFVGPADVDPVAVFTGGGLVLVPDTRVVDRFWEDLAAGEGRSPESGTCRVIVTRLRHGETLGHHEEGLSQAEVDGWYAGSLEVLQLFVDCEQDHGGMW